MNELKSKQKLPLGYKIIGAALILLSLVMFSTWLMSGLYARYLTSGNAGDGARVAAFGEVTITETQGTSYMIIPGVEITKNPVLSFGGSECKCYVFLTVKAPGWTTTDNIEYKIEIADTEHPIKWTLKNTIDTTRNWMPLDIEGEHVFYTVLDPNETLNDVQLIVDDKITVPNTVLHSDLEAIKTSDLSITFGAYVVQYGDFGSATTEQENAIAAYESAKNH